MKYDAEINPDDATTSHGLVGRLVGAHKRVLDVGCANGQLAKYLSANDNQVSGVEIDPEMGEAARVHLDRLVVGDIEQLDVVAEFGEGSFDVVVFADVLEHLRNPLGALRQARELLAPGGFVVASIPNVAHGSVRLALLQGRFEYRDLGLLDDTHLRFFTRSSVDALLRAAGFVPSMSLQTTAGPFETEIPLRPDDFSPSVLEQVERDPESRTYQFVVRAFPVSTGHNDEAVVTELLAKDREIQRLRGELAVIARHMEGSPRAPVIGLIDASGPSPELPALVRLRIAVSLAEIRRRLTGFTVWTYWLGAVPSETGFLGEVARPLEPWYRGRADQLAAEVEATVIIPGLSPAPGLSQVADDLVEAGCPVRTVIPDVPDWVAPAPASWIPAETPASTNDQVAPHMSAPKPLPDVIGLAPRLVSSAALARRADYLRIVGTLPEAGGFLLGHLAFGGETERERAWEALNAMARRADVACVLINASTDDSTSPATMVAGGELAPIDLLAMVASATLVVTDVPALATLAVGMARPALGVATEVPGAAGEPTFLDIPVGSPAELLALGQIAASDSSGELRGELMAGTLDPFFDDLTGDLVAAGARQLALTVPQRLEELADQVSALQSVNAGLRERLNRWGTIVVEYLQEIRDHGERADVGDAEVARAGRALQELRGAQAEIRRLQDEIEAIYATRTMRVVRPARRWYGRLRSLR